MENAVFDLLRPFRRAAMRAQVILFLAALAAAIALPALALARLVPWTVCLAAPALLALACAWGLAWRRVVERRFRAWSARQEDEPCSPASSPP